MTDEPPRITPAGPRLVTDPEEHTAAPQRDNIIRLNIVTLLDVDADQILQEAIGKLDGVIVIGYLKGDQDNRNADDEYFVSSIAAGDTVVWLLQRMIYKLMRIGDEEWEPGDDPSKNAS